MRVTKTVDYRWEIAENICSPLSELTKKFTVLFWSPGSPFYQQLDRDVLTLLYWMMLQCAIKDYRETQEPLFELPKVTSESLGTMPVINLYYSSNFDSPCEEDFVEEFGWDLTEPSQGVVAQITGGPYALTGTKWKVSSLFL
jgi:hypothetical protein